MLYDASLFVGSGADSEVVGRAADNGVGFQIQDAQLLLSVIRSGQVGDSRSYVALKAQLASAGLVGFEPDLIVEVSDLVLEINQASGNSEAGTAAGPLDWTTAVQRDVTPNIEGQSGAADLTIDFQRELLRVSGHMNLQAFGFASANADFVFSTRTIDQVQVTGGDPLPNASLAVFALNNANLFVGINGATDGTAGPNGLGFEATQAEMALALIKPADSSDRRRYLAAKARIATAGLVGMNDDVYVDGTRP